MNVNFLELSRGYSLFKKEYNLAIQNVLKKGIYILGDQVLSFEKNFASYIGSKYCVSLNSGLDALILALRSLNITMDDEVIVPAHTYIATILAITENKAKPVLVEPDEFYNLNSEIIESKITSKTKAIIVVHLYGQSSQMKKITELAKKHKLYLIEDCAQSHGSKYNNQTTGTFGDIGCFSFYPTKNIGAFGDSGAIVTNNPLLAEKIRMMRNYGSKVKYHHDIEGINSRMDEIQASILNVKLNHYKEILESRLKNVEFYLHNIHNQYIELPKVQKFSTSVFHLFVIRTKYRESLINYLKSNSISTMIHYPIPAHLTPALKFLHHKRGDFPITELIANEVLSLPLFDGITTNELSFVVKTINKFKPL